MPKYSTEVIRFLEHVPVYPVEAFPATIAKAAGFPQSFDTKRLDADAPLSEDDEGRLSFIGKREKVRYIAELQKRAALQGSTINWRNAQND